MSRFKLKPLLVLMTSCIVLIGAGETSLYEDEDRVNTWTEDKQVSYLSKYGYLGTPHTNPGVKTHIYTDQELSQGISQYQRLWGLTQTGKMDDETKALMTSPRCGNSDAKLLSQLSGEGRTKRYTTLPGDGWAKTHLTYRVRNTPSRLNQRDALSAISRAFNEWAKVSTLTFDRVESMPDIDILFASYSHGDDVPFDGAGGELAHTFYPIYGGDTHFDASETWTLYVGSGTDLFQVAVHEFGHALGLGHTSERAAIMNPYYRYIHPWQFHEDDIRGIHVLYGPPEEPAPATESPETRPLPPVATALQPANPPLQPPVNWPGENEGREESADYCGDSRIDTIVSNDLGEVFVFKGSYVAVLSDSGIAPGFPMLTSAALPDLPADLDAALTLPDLYQTSCLYYRGRYYNCRRTLIESQRTYLFKGSLYYLYQDSYQGSGEMSSLFPGMPTHIDAAYSVDGRTISFIKGSDVWRITRLALAPDEGYPKPLSEVIQGLPDHIDAAFKLNGGFYTRHYFFSGSQYYRVSGGGNTVDRSNPPYPRSTREWWFGCKTGSSQMAASLHAGPAPSEWGMEANLTHHQPEVYVDENGKILKLNASDIDWITDDEANKAGSYRLYQLYWIIHVGLIALFSWFCIL